MACFADDTMTEKALEPVAQPLLALIVMVSCLHLFSSWELARTSKIVTLRMT